MRAAPVRVAKPAQPKAADSEFERWYMEHLGEQYTGQEFLTKPEDMDAATWAVGQTLYNLYNTEKQTDTALENQKKQIDIQQDYATQQAAIMNEKLQKYLKMAYAAQGAQVPGGDLIAAQNNYLNQLGQIGTEYTGLKTQAEQEAALAKQTAQGTAQQNLATIYGQQGSQEEQEKEQQKLIYQSAIENTLAQMASGFEVDEETGEYKAEDYEKLMEYYLKNKEYLDETAQKYIEFVLENDYPHENAPSIDEADSADISEFIQGKTSMGINGKLYRRVEIDQPQQVGVRADVIKASLLTDKKLTNGQYYKHTDGNEYIYYNGKLYLIEPTN